MADRKLENFSALSVSSTEHQLLEQLRKLAASLTPKDLGATLSTLRRIFDNIIQHPNDDKYRQIKLTSKTFSSKVWQYPAGEELMKMSGWVVEDDHVRLKDEWCVRILLHFLVQKLGEIGNSTSLPSCNTLSKSTLLGKRSRDQCISADTHSSSKCIECFSISKDTGPIKVAVLSGNGSRLKKLLSQYDIGHAKNIQLDAGPIIQYAYMAGQIGIVRILVNEYGVNPNISGEDGLMHFFEIFDRSDSTEAYQSYIIHFIKEFNIDVHNQGCHCTALHIAMLHKLYTVAKFLVEECKVDVNCILNPSDGTPLHMAYGIGKANIAKYLIKHGANQEAIDDNGMKPKDYEFFENNFYAFLSKYLLKKRAIYKCTGSEVDHYLELRSQGISDPEAVDSTFEMFPDLHKLIHHGYNTWLSSLAGKYASSDSLVNQQLLEATPTLNKLNRYIIHMAPSYYKIGLQLDIVNRRLKLIKNDISLSDLEERCRKMLEVWLENDTSATWKKLRDALQEVELNNLAEQIKDSIVE